MGAFRIGTEAAEPVEREHNQAALAIAAAVVGPAYWNLCHRIVQASRSRLTRPSVGLAQPRSLALHPRT